MQNLRDKLLKAGKVNKKQARQVEHNARQQRRSGQGPDPAQQAAEAEQRRQALYEEKLREQRERDRALEQARRAEREAHEQRLRVRYIADHYGLRLRPGKRRWFFMGRDQRIHHLDVTPEEALNLEYGRHAVVERPDELDPDSFAVVPRETADLIWSIDDAYVRFYNRNEQERPPRWWEHPRNADDPAPNP